MADFAPHTLTSNISNPPFVVTQSSQFTGLEAWRAFDGGFGTGQYWIGTGGGVDWLQLDCGNGVRKILQTYDLKMNTIPENARAPQAWTMLGSFDGIVWNTLDTVTGQTSWTNGELRSFTCDTATTGYRYFRISITSNNGDATYTQIAELYLNGIDDTSDLPYFSPSDLTSNTSHSPFVSTASTTFMANTAYKAFDGDIGSQQYWLGTNAGVDWLKLDCGSGNLYTLTSYSLQVNTIPEANRAPNDWTMEGSNDDSTWSTLDTVTNEASWTSGETRTFTCDTATTAYRYFRLNITSNNGDATYTQVAELKLYGTPASSGGVIAFGGLTGGMQELLGGMRG